MRLWHKDLISVLPKNQLIGQWRECCAIAKAIAENGTPNHVLVNRIMDFPLEHFAIYARFVFAEMIKRGYNVDFWKFKKWIFEYNPVSFEKLFSNWHNDRYLKQCYYNLQEKYDCGGISEEDWIRIKNKFEEKLNY